MADKTKRVDYFSLELPDKPGEAFRILGKLKEVGVNLLNCTGFPTAPGGGFGMILWVKPQDLEAAAKALGV
jgi:hypothetical protein